MKHLWVSGLDESAMFWNEFINIAAITFLLFTSNKFPFNQVNGSKQIHEWLKVIFSNLEIYIYICFNLLHEANLLTVLWRKPLPLLDKSQWSVDYKHPNFIGGECRHRVWSPVEFICQVNLSSWLYLFTT